LLPEPNNNITCKLNNKLTYNTFLRVWKESHVPSITEETWQLGSKQPIKLLLELLASWPNSNTGKQQKQTILSGKPLKLKDQLTQQTNCQAWNKQVCLNKKFKIIAHVHWRARRQRKSEDRTETTEDRNLWSHIKHQWLDSMIKHTKVVISFVFALWIVTICKALENYFKFTTGTGTRKKLAWRHTCKFWELLARRASWIIYHVFANLCLLNED